MNHLLTHKPFNIHCDACSSGKMRKAKKFVGSCHASRQPTGWLDLATADHFVAKNGGMEGITGDFDTLVVKDLCSKVKVFLPVRNKTAEQATRALRYFFGDNAVGRFYSDSAPELGLSCTTLGIVHEKSRAGVPQNISIIERTNLDILEGIRTTLICAGFPERFWPFAAQHFASLRTPLPSVLTEKYKDGSSYHRAHGQGEAVALRIPFGCAIYFIPADTEGFPKGKFEGSGEAGVIAGYNMSPGYVWDGGYLCWSLKELANIGMMAKASKHPPGFQSPHVTKKIRFPSGNSCRFPLKEKYDRQFRSIGGLDEIQTVRQRDNNVVSHLVCPEEHVDLDIPDTTKPHPTVDESSSSGITPPQPGVLNRMDVHLGVGYEFNAEGHLCRRDVIKRFYKVDEYGKRIANRTTTCPPHLDGGTWRNTFTPKDRITWYLDMKAREVAEAKAREASASSSTSVINPVALPDVVPVPQTFPGDNSFINADTGHGGPWLSDAEWADMRERATAFANRAIQALFAAPKKRRSNPVHKIKQLGIAGLFSEGNEAYIYDESDSEASTSGAAPASIVESEDEEVPPWVPLEDEREVESSICAAAQASPHKGYDHIPAMPCVAD